MTEQPAIDTGGGASSDDESDVNLKSNLQVDVQNAIEGVLDSGLPSQTQLAQWAGLAYRTAQPLQQLPLSNEVSVRLVELDEITSLNRDFRGKDKPTNVLSFPFEVPEGVDLSLLGDVVICHEIVRREAQAQEKTIEQHYAHMVTHGILHLCGYDHQCDVTANEMESLEIQILAASGIPNPYSA